MSSSWLVSHRPLLTSKARIRVMGSRSRHWDSSSVVRYTGVPSYVEWGANR